MLLDGSVEEFKGFRAWNGVEGDDAIAELLRDLGSGRMISSGDYVVYKRGRGIDEEIFIARIIAHKVKE